MKDQLSSGTLKRKTSHHTVMISEQFRQDLFTSGSLCQKGDLRFYVITKATPVVLVRWFPPKSCLKSGHYNNGGKNMSGKPWMTHQSRSNAAVAKKRIRCCLLSAGMLGDGWHTGLSGALMGLAEGESLARELFWNMQLMFRGDYWFCSSVFWMKALFPDTRQVLLVVMWPDVLIFFFYHGNWTPGFNFKAVEFKWDTMMMWNVTCFFLLHISITTFPLMPFCWSHHWSPRCVY